MARREPRHGEFELRLPPAVVDAMQGDVARVAEQVVAAVISEVPSYSEPFRGRMGRNIETAVALALGGFLDAASGSRGEGGGGRIATVFDAAYNLGRGEARSGRSMDALAAAYRVGASRAWRDMSATAVEAGLPAEELAQFAGLVFDYIDQLSGASVAGHADELAMAGRLRERQLAALSTGLLAGRAADLLESLAEQAGWKPPRTLTAVVLPQSSAGAVRAQLDSRTLELSGDVPGLEPWPQLAVLLVPGIPDSRRRTLVRSLGTIESTVGPTRPWLRVEESYQRALRALQIGLDTGRPLDTEEHLATLVVTADSAALADLRTRVLAPLVDVRPSAAEKLTDTLRAWLLHQGRRDDVAAALFVHPQTVRYRMGQLRELYGDLLEDPDFVRDATVALAAPPAG
jgi:hypothetical protein